MDWREVELIRENIKVKKENAKLREDLKEQAEIIREQARVCDRCTHREKLARITDWGNRVARELGAFWAIINPNITTFKREFKKLHGEWVRIDAENEPPAPKPPLQAAGAEDAKFPPTGVRIPGAASAATAVGDGKAGDPPAGYCNGGDWGEIGAHECIKDTPGVCTCGHEIHDHHDPDYRQPPLAAECRVENCDCTDYKASPASQPREISSAPKKEIKGFVYDGDPNGYTKCSKCGDKHAWISTVTEQDEQAWYCGNCLLVAYLKEPPAPKTPRDSPLDGSARAENEKATSGFDSPRGDGKAGGPLVSLLGDFGSVSGRNVFLGQDGIHIGGNIIMYDAIDHVFVRNLCIWARKGWDREEPTMEQVKIACLEAVGHDDVLLALRWLGEEVRKRAPITADELDEIDEEGREQ